MYCLTHSVCVALGMPGWTPREPCVHGPMDPMDHQKCERLKWGHRLKPMAE